MTDKIAQLEKENVELKKQLADIQKQMKDIVTKRRQREKAKYLKQKDKIKARFKAKQKTVTCSCGIQVLNVSLKRHEKSRKHQEAIDKLNIKAENEDRKEMEKPEITKEMKEEIKQEIEQENHVQMKIVSPSSEDTLDPNLTETEEYVQDWK